ncbi:PLP-dependent aminotransferase family protein [Dactylosporangium sp. McL0621]|uniref:aminotransferase-like domain-containing protein n=1 Tax=Dactylosporangium sp. McL0621 TaxID=3415678 RepID=UPI003CF867B4
MSPVYPVTQYVPRPGVLDLGWGHPRPDLLPVEAWLDATRAALAEHGWQALTYGASPGPGPLLEWLAGHLTTVDGPCREDELFVTGGASQALALAGAVLIRPGDVVLVDAPTYHLAFAVLRDLGATLVSVPADAEGPDPEATAALAGRLRRAGRRVSALYLVPTFGNPTGRSLPARRRDDLLAAARRAAVTVIEDDTYRELAYDGAAPASLWSRGGGEGVVRLGSFAKTVAPGVRLGWLTADRATVAAVAARGWVNSGGGVNHTNALAMAAFGRSGAYARHTGHLRGEYRRQRNALAGALRAAAPALDVAVPHGGWFLWAGLPAGLTADALLPVAERHGVSFVPGPQFHCDGAGGAGHVRLSYSMLPPVELAEAARRLGAALNRV